MNGSKGRGLRASSLCVPCDIERRHAERRWTRETVVAAIQRWAAEHGGVAPSGTEWLVKPFDWTPNTYLVQRVFDDGYGGGWRAALVAAGFGDQINKWRKRLAA